MAHGRHHFQPKKRQMGRETIIWKSDLENDVYLQLDFQNEYKSAVI